MFIYRERKRELFGCLWFMLVVAVSESSPLSYDTHTLSHCMHPVMVRSWHGQSSFESAEQQLVFAQIGLAQVLRCRSAYMT